MGSQSFVFERHALLLVEFLACVFLMYKALRNSPRAAPAARILAFRIAAILALSDSLERVKGIEPSS
jgi:hypothetical protein